jgi:hypothetical protein
MNKNITKAIPLEFTKATCFHFFHRLHEYGGFYRENRLILFNKEFINFEHGILAMNIQNLRSLSNKIKGRHNYI